MKKISLIGSALLAAAVLCVSPVSLHQSRDTGLSLSVDKAQAYYGHHRRVHRRVHRRAYYYHGAYYPYRYHGHYYRYHHNHHYYNHRRLYHHHYRYW